MLYQEFLKKKLYSILERFLKKNWYIWLKKIEFSIDISPKKEFGDVSSNIAMIFCKILKLAPMDLAEKIISYFKKENEIEKIEVIKPGFINFLITFLAKTIRGILEFK